MCVRVCVCGCVCQSEHNVPSIHSSLLAKPDGVHQSETPSHTTPLQFLNENKQILIFQLDHTFTFTLTNDLHLNGASVVIAQ